MNFHGSLLTLLLLASCSEPEIAAPASPPATTDSFDARLAAIHAEWHGTPWDYSGTTTTPGRGSIACGYFVTTTLEQAGLTLDRFRLAQAPSETMILELAIPETVKRYSNASLEHFLSSIRKQGTGYYIVGLDSHTGFLRVAPSGRVAFIHSGPGRGVVEESPENAPELLHSRYRVTGKIEG